MMVTDCPPARAVALAAALVCAAGSRAQTFEPPGAVAQIGPASVPADDTQSGQIGTAAPRVAPVDRTAPPSARPSPQLATPGDAAPPTQLVREKRAARGSAQLSDGQRSAQSSTPLSKPADGRTGTVAKVGGRDRCDPAAIGGAPRKDCAAVIETRGAEFPPQRVEPLSPEQRLLVEQRVVQARGTEPGSIARTASRRIGRDGADADAPQMQGIASVVLGTNAPPPPRGDDPTPGLTADQAAIATSVLGALDGTKP